LFGEEDGPSAAEGHRQDVGRHLFLSGDNKGMRTWRRRRRLVGPFVSLSTTFGFGFAALDNQHRN